MTWYISRRRLFQKVLLLVAIALTCVIVVLAFNSSLYRTIPAILPLFNSIPVYRNRWIYTTPTTVHHPNQDKYNAALVAFVDSDHASIGKLRRTMRDLEDNFNRYHNYPYIIFSPELLNTEYKELIASLTKGDVMFYDEIDEYTYGYANDTDHGRAEVARNKLKNVVVYGDDEHYRFRARFMAGLIFSHPALEKVDYYWRFDPGTEYTCPITFDPFQYMHENKIKLSFSVAPYEPFEAMPTLCDTLDKYLKENPSKETSLNELIRKENGKCTRCTLSSSFQIADLSFFKSEQYRAFFEHIDKANGIFYERWSDSVIQSLAAGLFLEEKDIHHWENIGYQATPYISHCPQDKSLWLKCNCRPEHNFDTDPLSCLPKFSATKKKL
ncbi:nucleotide-diphospho-sugar transferase [Zychaea mexicana]|uniref:nucleotide-diphospho-sugar transferase n=1 Tax=Zychaea mexicana TaxID=64656 RepID=UPI0022FE7A98|nr:nucleotide-diphospho-sugar transferase [Zychaea mexicana]KAI9488989.1 nucleotide-diphospho-sugar transferase [Zychaea mexicana]